METAVIREKQDLTYLNWTKTRESSGTAGSFLKAYSELNGIKTYYKLSNYDTINGITGHESVNEIIVDRLLSILGISHLHYQLIHADILVNGTILETWLCVSEDFKKRGESKIALDQYYNAEKLEDESPLAFCLRQGWADYIWEMLLVDYLILNRDRHGANIEILRNTTRKTYGPAPLFDHGLSLVCRCTDETSLQAFDIMEDRRIQCFVGSQSAWENLKLIPKNALRNIHPLKETDRDELFRDMNGILPQVWFNKIWEMIWKRWSTYEDLFNKE